MTQVCMSETNDMKKVVVVGGATKNFIERPNFSWW